MRRTGPPPRLLTAAAALAALGLILGASACRRDSAPQAPEQGRDRHVGRATGWSMGTPRLTTPWTSQVAPGDALPEYPRPQLTRPAWKSLNGVWQFAGATAGEPPPFAQDLAERVLVPYPVESALSGIQRHEDHMWYRRTFEVPKRWHIGAGNRLRIDFGAVDYHATVWVNGQKVAEHTGGYDHFSADVTDALTPSGPQEIVVGVEDRADATWQPVGKQRRVPDRGIFYTGASGIWQTVWMEPVNAKGYVATLHMVPDVDSSTLALSVETGGDARGLTAAATVMRGDRPVSRASGPAGETIEVPVPHERLWSPDDPFLYDLRVVLKRGSQRVDRVGSYFGMREVGTARGADGRLHITLNHEITFLMSTLDQGYWPDGIYTAPTDDALRSDIAQTKRLGFNTIRKHMKVEPDRWYYWADRLGVMVWQDMPAMKPGGLPPPPARREFERQLHEMVREHEAWTSVIGWVPFNEGWGEWSRKATGRIARSVKEQDPSRLVDAHSGVNCCDSLGDSGRGDVVDWHAYVGPATPEPDPHRVALDGEHGGFGLEVPGHLWFRSGHAYRMTHSRRELTRRYVVNQRALLAAARRCGLSGAVYTQLTDVEHEVNGFLTYDRRLEKVYVGPVRAVNWSVIRRADGSAVPHSACGEP